MYWAVRTVNARRGDCETRKHRRTSGTFAVEEQNRHCYSLLLKLARPMLVLDTTKRTQTALSTSPPLGQSAWIWSAAAGAMLINPAQKRAKTRKLVPHMHSSCDGPVCKHVGILHAC